MRTALGLLVAVSLVASACSRNAQRMSYDDATLFSEVVDLLPGSCASAAPKNARQLANHFSANAFHLAFMRQGTIPAGYFPDALLSELQRP